MTASSIPFSQLKMAEITDPNVLNELEKFGKATCLITAGGFKGTGFHFGSGWIMSVAHNFQDDATDNERSHSLLPTAKFTFHEPPSPAEPSSLAEPSPSAESSSPAETSYSAEFSSHDRMAFIHHLQPGDEVDPRNMDIALVKLGIQYEYGGRGGGDWEKEEQQKLNEMELTCFAKIRERQVSVNETVYAIHYGGDNNRKMVKLTVTGVSPATNENPIPTIQLRPAIQPGASGCPILNQDYQLVGFLCGGGPPGSAQAVDNALMWNGGIKEYASNGVSIIAEFEGYLASKYMGVRAGTMNEAFQQRASATIVDLNERARVSKLTVYLMNGEKFDGTVDIVATVP